MLSTSRIHTVSPLAPSSLCSDNSLSTNPLTIRSCNWRFFQSTRTDFLEEKQGVSELILSCFSFIGGWVYVCVCVSKSYAFTKGFIAYVSNIGTKWALQLSPKRFIEWRRDWLAPNISSYKLIVSPKWT